MIRIESLTKKFGRFTAVDGLSLNIEPGESVALWGPNGAGKSTIIRCVLGLVGFSGDVEVGGLSVARHGKQARRLIGYVPQELGFYDDLRVNAAIGYFSRLKGERVRSPERVLAEVGLDGHHRKRIRELSGGMKQRLALGLALIGNPPVLVLDEVTASLDASGRDGFVQVLSGLARSGRTMLFASHRQEEVRALADRVVVLRAGKVERECTPEQLLSGESPDQTLRLHVGRSQAAFAIEALRARGIAARLNGVGILVNVGAGKRAVPMQALAEARITFDDFEIVPDAEHGKDGGHE